MRDLRLKESQNHGVPEFPVSYYYVDGTHPRYEMSLHWHPEFEIVRVKQGTLNLYVNNILHTLQTGDIAFIGCGMMHHGVPDNAVYECVVFSPNMFYRHGVGRIANYIIPIRSNEVEIPYIHASEQGELPEAVNSFFDFLANESSYFELKVYSLAAEIIYLLYVGNRIVFSQKQVSASHSKQTIPTLIEWIEENYTKKITLGMLAGISKTNEKYLCRFFKEYTGHTPIDYINRLRVERACLKIAEENYNITEAAIDCGFNDISYFSKTFRHYKNITPSEYRRMLCLDEKN